MNDVLLEIGKNPRARQLVKALGLPLPIPEALRRDKGPFAEAPLAGRRVLVLRASQAFEASIAAIARAGAAVERASEAAERFDAVVLDATAVADARALRALYDALHPVVTKIGRSGRVVVIGRPSSDDPTSSAAQAAIEGFVRSVAKELGRVAATANLLRVSPGAEARASSPLVFLLSARSAFVSAQPLDVDALARGNDASPVLRPLRGKVALVTGAARGIGEATARQLADEGAHVLCVDRPEDAETLRDLAHGIGGSVVAVDLTSKEAPETIAAAVRERGGVDVVVHNAGITRDKTLARMDASQWDAVIAVNLDAVLRLQAALDPLLRENGRVVCLSSIAGLAGNVGQTAYAASKAAIAGYVAALAPHLAPRGITANAVAPGFIETRLTRAIPVAVREVARRLSALGQGGLPEDVANAIAFLARPDAGGVTGRTLRVCGGAFVGR